MSKSDKEKYEIIERAAREHAEWLRKRRDLDEATKNQAILNNAAELDKIRKQKGIKE